MYIIHANGDFCKNAGRELRICIKISALHNFVCFIYVCAVRIVCRRRWVVRKLRIYRPPAVQNMPKNSQKKAAAFIRLPFMCPEICLTGAWRGQACCPARVRAKAVRPVRRPTRGRTVRCPRRIPARSRTAARCCPRAASFLDRAPARRPCRPAG